ncbi:protein of unknown function [Candidatus Hydrogenisulfobacillus filiaventi]|uniref:Uncharacterized protein n=1 Tax=Candidatus Hydrogenisulfobacillus filiaventi TaxID=2707344 RepID=A0A6F8ZG04_9FIRM|nr:protein of unknown function [Candidatus Hydrogenisulfobacillus filiaventi]
MPVVRIRECAQSRRMDPLREREGGALVERFTGRDLHQA